MCGVVGCVSLRPQGQILGLMQGALDLMDHRGPDDRGFTFGECGRFTYGIGQTRLAIIDLSDGGHQPVVTPDGRFLLAFNGEIYNYRELGSELMSRGVRLSTDSDSEVLLYALITWGMAALSRLKGMFAFAFLDRAEGKLTLARDAFGIKPLYYRLNQYEFCFASEVPALHVISDKRPLPNNEAVLDYLSFGDYDCGPRTFFEDVQRLEAGHVMTLDLREPKLLGANCRWWQPSIEEDETLTFSQAAEQLRELLLVSTTLHLRSDVPLGFSLSGGLDSAALVCLARHVEPNVPIQTIGYVAGGSPYDESHWMRLVNDSVQAESHYIHVDAGEVVPSLPALIAAQGEPFGSTSIYAQYRVHQHAHSLGLKVMIEGQGADEIFAGYHGYPEYRIRSMIARREYLEAATFLTRWSQLPGRSRYKAAAIAGKELLGLSSGSSILEMKRGLRRPSYLRDLSSADWRDVVRRNSGRDIVTRHVDRSLTMRLRHGLSAGDLERLLRHGDRNAMAWSVENRVPFLDVAIAELGLRVPEQYLISSAGTTKSLLRAALKGLVPDDILARKDKIGFATPEQAWLSEDMLGTLDWQDGLKRLDGIDVRRARTHVQDVIRGQARFGPNCWRLINLGIWANVALG